MGNTTKNTEAAQKAYKKAKKQRRKIRKAEQLAKQGNTTTVKKQNNEPDRRWRRVMKEDGAKKAVDRPLEVGYGVDKINDLLERRSKAKEEKNYDVSDKITKTLVTLQIVYDDDKREWHTRVWKMPKPLG